MILYNSKKEFVGIEEQDLKALKLSTLAELQKEASDFADLFVKAPGYIHNFKYVHWIDFIGGTDSIDENRVIIEVKGRSFKATMEVRKLYMNDEPDKEAYGIVLNGLRELTRDEKEDILNNRIQSENAAPTVTTVPPAVEEEPIQKPQEEEHNVVRTEAEPKEEKMDDEPLTLDLESSVSQEVPQKAEETTTEDAPLEIGLEPEEAKAQEEPFLIYEEDEKFKDYRYNPEITAKELGLPSDLVEEFVQDFIVQAKEFKPELYTALDTGRLDNLRMLSHKLKGVAANLRIEDAYEALITINTADDIDLLKRTLDYFYMIILEKLAGNEVQIVTTPKMESSRPQEQEADSDAITLDLDADEPLLEAPSEEEAEGVQPSAEENEEKIELLLDDEEPVEEKEDVLEPIVIEEEETPIELVLDEDENTDTELPVEIEEGVVSVERIKIDKLHIASELGIEIEVYEELLVDYISDMQGGLVQLEEAVEKGESESAQKLAFRLKGMSDNMRLEPIAKELEHFIKDEGADKTAILKKIKTQIDSIEGV